MDSSSLLLGEKGDVQRLLIMMVASSRTQIKARIEGPDRDRQGVQQGIQGVDVHDFQSRCSSIMNIVKSVQSRHPKACPTHVREVAYSDPLPQEDYGPWPHQSRLSCRLNNFCNYDVSPASP